MATIPSYYEGLLSEDDMSSLRNQSLASGLLSAGAAFSRAGAPSLMPGGSGFSEALQGFNQGYQGQLDSALNNMLRATQVQELIRKQKQAQQMQQALAGAYTSVPQAIPMATGKGSQLEMLSRPEFGGGMADAQTVDALTGNLPTTKTLDFNKLVDVIGQFNPVEAAKLLKPKENKLTGSVGEFSEAKQLGLIPQTMSYEQFKAIGKGPLVTMTPGDTELEKLDAKAVSAISDQVNSSRVAANTANSIRLLLAGQGGGDVVKIGANLAQTLGIQGETSSANALAQALQVKAATQVRAAGSGSTSDLEFKSFLSVFPGLGNSEQGRNLMADGLQAFAVRDSLIERKARELLKSKTYSAGALSEYDASLGPVLDPKKFGDLNRFAPSSGTTKPVSRRSF